MGITIGDLLFNIRGDSSKLPADVEAAGAQASGVMAGIQQSMTVAAGQIIANGLQQMSSGLMNMTKGIIDDSIKYGNQVEDMARQTGMSTEDTSRMIQVADDMRIEYGQLSSAMTLYSKSQKDAGNNTIIGIDTIAALSDQYLKLAPGIERNNFLLANFGRGGMAMAKMMEQGGASIKKMSSEVEDSLVLTKDQVVAAEAARKAFDDWDDAVLGLKIEFGKELLPVITDFMKAVVTDLIPIIKSIIMFFGSLPKEVKYTMIVIGGFITFLLSIAPNLFALFASLNMILGPAGLAGIGTAITGALAPVAAAIAAITAPVWGLIAAIGLLIVVVNTLGPTALNSLKMIWEIDKVMVSRVFEAFQNVGKSIIMGIGQGILTSMGWLQNLMVKLAHSLPAWMQKALGINSPSKVFAELVGKPSAEGIGEGFNKTLSVTAGSMSNNLTQLAPAVMGGGGNGSNSYHVEYHGAFSDKERAWFDKRSKSNVGRVLTKALK
jgi:hypothetical protein